MNLAYEGFKDNLNWQGLSRAKESPPEVNPLS